MLSPVNNEDLYLLSWVKETDELGVKRAGHCSVMYAQSDGRIWKELLKTGYDV